MENEFKPSDIVYHVIDRRTPIIIVEKSPDFTNYFTCRYRNTITGLFVVEGFYGFELSLTQEASK